MVYAIFQLIARSGKIGNYEKYVQGIPLSIGAFAGQKWHNYAGSVLQRIRHNPRRAVADLLRHVQQFYLFANGNSQKIGAIYGGCVPFVTAIWGFNFVQKNVSPSIYL